MRAATAAPASGSPSCGGWSSCTAASCARRARARTAAAASASRCPWRPSRSLSRDRGRAGRRDRARPGGPRGAGRRGRAARPRTSCGWSSRTCWAASPASATTASRPMLEAAERPPALILLDLMLPRVSGWEVARRLRQSPRTAAVPIIAVSALSRPAGARGRAARRLRRLPHQAVHARRAGPPGHHHAPEPGVAVR